jgi:hypothetical protein
LHIVIRDPLRDHRSRRLEDERRPIHPHVHSGGPTSGQDTTKFGLGYQYFLSKRTSVHADVGMARTEGVSRTTGFEAGIKHTF